MKAFTVFALAVAAVVAAGTSAYGRPQPQMFCWTPDVEFPVACEDDDEDDEEYRELLLTVCVPWRGQPLMRVRPSSPGILACGAVG